MMALCLGLALASAPIANAATCPTTLSNSVDPNDASTSTGSGSLLGPKACRYLLPDNGMPAKPSDGAVLQACQTREGQASQKLTFGAWASADVAKRCACYINALKTRPVMKFDQAAPGTKAITYLSYSTLLSCLPQPPAAPSKK